jgi:uncharacterized iron-regulated protein
MAAHRQVNMKSERDTDHSTLAAGATLWLRTVVLSASLLAASAAAAQTISSGAPAQSAPACASYGGWVDVRSGRSIDREGLFRYLASRRTIVLLGESHTEMDHHLWQLGTLAALQGRGANLVIGFEAFPRRLQSVLNDWVDGKLTDAAFLKASEWQQVWGYDSALYMPLFRFARLNRIPMIALNVERRLVLQVGQRGWESVPVTEREGLSDPAPASAAYQRVLARAYLAKKTLQPGATNRAAQGPDLPEPDEAELTEAMNEPEFKRFVEAQLTWDRAMAEALAEARQNFANAVVVGILGSGHVAGGHGVPRQLRALGIYEPASLIPATVDVACTLIGAGYADAIFTLPRADETPPSEQPHLGVLLGEGEGSPRIDRVVNDSVAEIAGLKAGDQVVRAAGLPMRSIEDLTEVVARQAPGTWLPLSIRRDGHEIDIIAKFPPRRTN